MLFFHTYMQSLSLYPGAFIKLNHLYDRDEGRFKKEHSEHLLWVFYPKKCSKEIDKLFFLVIHVSWDLVELRSTPSLGPN